MENHRPLLLVDGSSYLFRAFHALPPLVNSKGQPTGAIKGVISMIRKLIADNPEHNVAIVFDAKGKTFRNDLYQAYKATRPPMPDDLRSQIQPIHDIVRLMGLPLLMQEGVEADDIIGTLAKQGTDLQVDVLISTGDKDMAQLVNEHVTLINTMTDTRMDIQGVKDKFGVLPDQIIDYLALMGDTSDNIPGVPKVGPKTAVKWLNEYGSLDNIIANAHEISGKIGENLRAALDQLPLSHQLATIKLDVELDSGPTELVPGESDTEGLRKIFTELEFRQWLDEFDQVEEPAAADPVSREYEMVTTEQQLDDWIAALGKAGVFAFDTETTSLDYMQATLVGVSFAAEPGKAAYVPCGHDYPGAPEQLAVEFLLQKLRPLLEDAAVGKIGQNLKYDRSVLANYGVSLEGISHDTMLESYVLNSVGSRHNMDDLALKYLGLRTIHFEDIAGKGAKQLTFNQIDLDKAAEYAAEDADITLRLHNALWPKLEREQKLQKLFEEIEVPLIPVLSNMERNGVLLDADLLGKQSEELAARMDELEREAHSLAGEEFNLGSPKQLQEIFFEKLNLPVLKKTPKGQPSTAERVLQQLALDFPLPKVIMDYRALSKLKSTYTDQLPKQINAATGRVHTSYHQAVAATGRLSSTNPNLQNIPIRTAEGRRVRKAFIAPDGYKLIAADYSQIELRIMAHLSKDEGLLNAFSTGQDVHRATAAEVFGVSKKAVSDEQRRSAKAINFGLIYGMSAFGLAGQINVSRGAAQEYIDLYFNRYPGVKQYMDSTRASAADLGYVETLFGRRLYLEEIRSSNYMRRQAAERTAINAPMQGTAADIIKIAMIDVDNWLQDHKVDATMIMQVHDELVLEVSVPQVDEVIEEVEKRMSRAAELDVPLLVEVGIGDDWDAAH
ncbi:MAG: DNA polymerase I [Pseudomonadales bacterium]|jgi:DNA polymerase-1|nr:DNA polymerase I [Pseudomonadales bacterium]MDP7360936.1 DNA polymerase I [Pseudomonadales bacterium]HJN52055.1 DNA polymerase I [Pseudomonadales bacterium]|tara:strand:- start:1808 stop:4498 length:2691 start_codon:yes stop_codon:yes gene_type:complete